MRKGEVVLVPFPFTDLSGKKVRPALVLFASSKSEDFICAFISSTDRGKFGMFEISVAPSPKNGLKSGSFIKLGKLATLQKNVAIGVLGNLEPGYMKTVDEKMRKLLGL